MASSRKNSSFRLNANKQQSKNDHSPSDHQDDLDSAFDAEHNINNPFSSSQISTSTSKWSINEQWRKLQQMIESKDKTNQAIKNKENVNSQELANFSNEDHLEIMNEILDYSIHEGEEVQEGISYVDFSDLSEEKDASKKDLNISLPLDNSNNNSSFNSGNLPTTTTITKQDKESNKKAETPPPSRTTHTFLFSKMKLNELDDKEYEKELFDKKHASISKEQLIFKPSSQSNSNEQQPINKQPPQIKFSNSTPTKQSQSSINSRTPIKSSSVPSLLSASAFSSSKNKQLNKRMNRMKEFNFNECDEESSSIDGFYNNNNTNNDLNSTDSFDKNLFKSKKKSKDSITQSQPIDNIDEPIPSLPYFTSFIVDLFRERFNFISFFTSFLAFFILIFAIQLSPMSSFANGVLIGIVFSLLFTCIIIVYALNYVFQKIDFENDLHERIMKNEKWTKYPAYEKVQKKDDKLKATTTASANNQQNCVHEGWFFELVYSKKLGVDRLSASEKFDYDKMPDTKLQLTYIKLEGTIIRVYVPKADQSKKLKPDMEKLNFVKVSNKMNQHIYDFAKMNTKKIQLWLPKNIINKKKYLWSRKFPFILIIEETNKMSENKRNPFALILFCRTNRDKEEWYNQFRRSIEIADQNLR